MAGIIAKHITMKNVEMLTKATNVFVKTITLEHHFQSHANQFVWMVSWWNFPESQIVGIWTE